jgi:hypothetical protein
VGYLLHERMSLHDSTFSRTVWRLYGGAKGLVMWYYKVGYLLHERIAALTPLTKAQRAKAKASVDEGLLPLCLPILVCIKNPYRTTIGSGE